MHNRTQPGLIMAMVTAAAILFSSPAMATNDTYANLPPFISADAKANVIFVTDFSGSMQGPAYYGTEWDGYESSKVADYGDEGEVSASYNQNTEYYGYFDPDKYYSYDSTNKYWYVDTGTSYSNREAGNKDSLSGNLLNFIVTSRVDAVLKNLIGGKADCPVGADYCILESQGGRRWVEVTNLNADCHVRPEDYTNGDYLGKDMLISVEDEGGTSKIGTFSNRYARVKIDADDRKGVIQTNFDLVRFGLIAYANTSNDTAEQGMIKYGVHENSLTSLISALESTIPYSGTHTGEALREAYYYLTQDSSAQSYNDIYISDGTVKDPYYEKREDGTLEPAWCRKSFIVLISDGEWNGSIDPDTWAHNLHIDDLRETDGGGKKDKFPEKQNANVYSLFAFSDDQDGEDSMQTVAAFGSYNEIGTCTAGSPYTLSEGTSSLNNSFPPANCNPAGTYNNCCAEWDSEDRNGIPDAFYYASNGQALSQALTDIFEEIRQGTSSGTAVTALTSRVSSGNVIAQAAFYPDKEFDDGKTVVWTGDVFAEWYLNGFIEDATGASVLVQNIREDTDGDYELKIEKDRILEYLINNKNLTINAYDSNQYGTKKDATIDQSYNAIEDVKNLFDCGELLRTRDPDTRTIYGVAEDDTLKEFKAANQTSFDALLGTTAAEFPTCLLNAGNPQYDDLIDYTRGKDITNCRSRATNNLAGENVWKIGDIIYSSPTIVEYDDYAMVYTGSNAGILHAFRVGYIKNIGKPLNPAKLCDDDTAATCTHTKLGFEEWAFVPKDAMPYLRYMADPDYDHIYGVDLKPYIIDMGSKIILIGGMRLGGACNTGTVNPPADTDPVGRSAYFALDITDPQNPKYLWKYAPDGMGFTYSGPAYIKRKDAKNKWHYFVMFASGPNGYEGTSTQDLQIFTVDLFTGAEIDVFGDKPSELGINKGFGGRLFTNGLDVNEDGQTDFVFLGYTDNADGPYSKMKGGIIKIYTGSDDPKKWDFDKTYLSFAANPITAPIKAMDCFPDQLKFPFLYFGTGRYFVSDDKTQDHASASPDINHLYGVPFIYDENNARIAGGSSINSANNASALTCDSLDKINTNPQQASWYIPLTEAGGSFLRERSYSDPTTTEFNVLFFDTAQPTGVVCECGGRSRSWVVNCATGMGVGDVLCDTPGDDPTKYMVDSKIAFKYLVQLSGGDIQQHEKGEFSEDGGRTTKWHEGVPAEQGGLPTFPPGSILGQLLYWKQW